MNVKTPKELKSKNIHAKFLRTEISPFGGDERSELLEKCEMGVSTGVQGVYTRLSLPKFHFASTLGTRTFNSL